MSDSYDTRSAAIKHFLANTKMRKCKQRDALVDQIKRHPRPMYWANHLLELHGAKTITDRGFQIWLLRLIVKRGPFDPVFKGMIAATQAKAKRGKLLKTDLPPLEKILKDSWCPHSDEDKAAARKDAADRLVALGEHDPHEDGQGGS
jgi:hypothetical protein